MRITNFNKSITIFNEVIVISEKSKFTKYYNKNVLKNVYVGTERTLTINTVIQLLKVVKVRDLEFYVEPEEFKKNYHLYKNSRYFTFNLSDMIFDGEIPETLEPNSGGANDLLEKYGPRAIEIKAIYDNRVMGLATSHFKLTS